MNEDNSYLQPILGADSTNPSAFSVYENKQTAQLHVFYGLSVFDVVPNDKKHARFRLMIAHLRNLGIAQKHIGKAFNLDPRTVKHWGEVLASGDDHRIERVLLSSNNRKLTNTIKAYVRVRFGFLYPEDRYRYSSKIRSEIKDYFQEDISAETLRPLFNELKRQYNQEHPASQANCKSDGSDDRTSKHTDYQQAKESSGQDCVADSEDDAPVSQQSIEEGHSGSEKTLNLQDYSDQTTSNKDFSSANHNSNAFQAQPQGIRDGWCTHLGLIFFSHLLNCLYKVLDPHYANCILQWTQQILLGASNIEQSKLLDLNSLPLTNEDALMGNLTDQRNKLSELSSDYQEIGLHLFRWNFACVDQPLQRDFYFDPHTKPYSGNKNILKGWCSKKRWAERIQNGDYAHNSQGYPVYLENTDSYEDMRQRFIEFETNFRSTLGLQQEELTWIIDRGIYSQEIFDWVLSNPELHLITWERDYRQDGWPEGMSAQSSMVKRRVRNHKDDLRTYHFEWIEQPYPKHSKLRRILARATNPQGKTIQVSILTDHWQRSAESIIWSMFKRWTQENDFKYLSTHFGIDEITSYASESYAEIRDQLEDRSIQSSQYTAIQKSRQSERKHLANLLLKQRQAQGKQAKRQKQIDELRQAQALNSEQKRKLGSLRGSERSAQKYINKREEAISASEAKIAQIEQLLSETEKEVSRLDNLIEKGTQGLDTRKKQLMDTIRITARNIFYQAFAPFKAAYNNYRDDHVWFRHLTQTTSGMVSRSEIIQCQLLLRGTYPKSVKQAIVELFKHYNIEEPIELNGQKLQLDILAQTAIKLAI